MRTLVAASDAIMREGLSSVLADSPMEVVAVCASVAEATRTLAHLAPDVAFVEVQAARDPAALVALKQASPGTGIVLLGMRAEAEHLLGAIDHGVSGYLCQDLSLASLLLAAEAATHGFVLADAAAMRAACQALLRRKGASHDALVGRLTVREREVLRWLSRGLSNPEIAERLTVTPATVRTHVSNILEKLGLHDRVQAAVWASEHGLGPDDD